MSENQPRSPFPFEASSRDKCPDDPMGDDERSTPVPSSCARSSGPLMILSGPGSIAMSRSTNAPYWIGKPSSSSTSRQRSRNPTNPTKLLKRQIARAFKLISPTIHQSQDENLIALEALSYDAKMQYSSLQLLQTMLAKGESIVDQELTDAKRALATLE